MKFGDVTHNLINYKLSKLLTDLNESLLVYHVSFSN